MTESDVGRLYDALHAFEWRHRGPGVYPVHKKLRFDEPDMRDIYDWIAARADLPDGGDVLDAGCGVGFGALRLARGRSCRVTGISLSPQEVARARKAAVATDLADRVTFQPTSFDELPRAAYDLVVAVESLKHSSNLSKTLRSIRRSLKPRGQLVIVEDMNCTDVDVPIARRLAADWKLTGLYTEDDYLAALGAANCTIFDLSDRVRRTTARWLRSRLVLVEALLHLVPKRRCTALRAYRGGLLLEALYAQRQMAYKAIFYRHARHGVQ